MTDIHHIISTMKLNRMDMDVKDHYVDSDNSVIMPSSFSNRPINTRNPNNCLSDIAAQVLK